MAKTSDKKPLKSPWNSLEKAKFVLTIIQLLTNLAFTLVLFFFAEKLSKAKWLDQKVTEKRLEIYDTLMPRLNGIYCYFAQKGDYKKATPLDVIEWKRTADKCFYTNQLFLSKEFRDHYEYFTDSLCFSHPGGGEAKINGHSHQRRLWYEERDNINFSKKNWDKKWDAYILQTRDSAYYVGSDFKNLLTKHSEALMLSFMKDIGVDETN